MKNIEKTSVLFVFSKKKIFLGDWKLAKKWDVWNKKLLLKNNTVLKMIKKKKKLFSSIKMSVWIMDNRDSVTRPKSKNWKKMKNRIRLELCFFFSLYSSFYCAYSGNKAWLIGHFWAWHIIPYFLYHACIIQNIKWDA